MFVDRGQRRTKRTYLVPVKFESFLFINASMYSIFSSFSLSGGLESRSLFATPPQPQPRSPSPNPSRPNSGRGHPTYSSQTPDARPQQYHIPHVDKKQLKSGHIFPKIIVGDSHILFFCPQLRPQFFVGALTFYLFGRSFLAPTIPPVVFFPHTIRRLNECDIFDRFKAKARYSDGYVLEFYYLIKSVLMLF